MSTETATAEHPQSLRERIGRENMTQSSVLASHRLDEALLRLDRAAGRVRGNEFEPTSARPSQDVAYANRAAMSDESISNSPATGHDPAADHAHFEPSYHTPQRPRRSGLEFDHSVSQSSMMWLENEDTGEQLRLDAAQQPAPAPHFAPRSKPAPPAHQRHEQTVLPPEQAPQQIAEPKDATEPAKTTGNTESRISAGALEAMFAEPIDVMILSTTARIPETRADAKTEEPTGAPEQRSASAEADPATPARQEEPAVATQPPVVEPTAAVPPAVNSAIAIEPAPAIEKAPVAETVLPSVETPEQPQKEAQPEPAPAPATEPASATEPTPVPVAQAVSEPAVETSPEPAIEPVAETVTEPQPEPVVEEAPLVEFTAAWQVDEFVVPSTIDELFLSGSIAEKLAARLASAREQGLRTISITSTKPGEGRSTVAIGLALSVAFSGLRVALVDADREGVKIASDLHLDLDHSWTDAIRGNTALEEVAVSSDADAMTLLPLLERNGDAPFQSEELREMLATLRKSFDMVIVDCGPSSIADSVLCDTSLIVRDMQRTKALEVETLALSLRRNGISGVGVIENFC
ncbi:tyrosine-protein kinase family protein [Rhodopirellula sallentina]|uniref:Exopolysaccharide polymerization protein n=1 Tax=Rhodopirellula sallentina SM41 TaxID=1263870 RepID=M5U0P3_9BACT|nr:AAA family ATPase [Rhodopirellula sallentina]EMI54824.1 exopolysaccharide polymerization protein [Rhodopirellula sallentina SM41]